ncbi:hypothetical protein GCM10022217_33270 [Chryseobacterium ginsenosidimutans]
MKKKSFIFIGVALFMVLSVLAFKITNKYNDVKNLTPSELQAKNK